MSDELGCNNEKHNFTRYFEGPSHIWPTAHTFDVQFIQFDKMGRLYVRFLSRKIFEECGKHKAKVLGFHRQPKYRYPMSPEDIEVGLIVVAQTDTYIHVRAQVVALDKINEIVLVVDVDSGLIYELHFSRIFWIAPEFMNVQFQAKFVELAGLELFRGTDILKEIMRNDEKSLRQKLLHVTSFIVNGPIPSVRIAVDARKQRFLNTIAVERVSQYKPCIPCSPGTLISHIESDGLIYIQPDTPLLRLLLSSNKPDSAILSEYYEKAQGRVLDDVADVKRKFGFNVKVFYGRYTDGNFYRVFLHRQISKMDQYQVEFMDFGNRMVLNVGELKICEDFGLGFELVKDIPRQCIAVQLAGVGYVDISKVWDHIDIDSSIFSVEDTEEMRHITAHNDHLPLVTIYFWPEGIDGPKLNFNEFLVAIGVAKEEYLLGKLKPKPSTIKNGYIVDVSEESKAEEVKEADKGETTTVTKKPVEAKNKQELSKATTNADDVQQSANFAEMVNYANLAKVSAAVSRAEVAVAVEKAFRKLELDKTRATFGMVEFD